MDKQNHIETFFHCTRCLEELPPGEAPMNWARLNVGLTATGLQVWCVRHKLNVAEIDFEGRDHLVEVGRDPATLSSKIKVSFIRTRGCQDPRHKEVT